MSKQKVTVSKKRIVAALSIPIAIAVIGIWLLLYGGVPSVIGLYILAGLLAGAIVMVVYFAYLKSKQ